jgi:hypothetical protein
VERSKANAAGNSRTLWEIDGGRFWSAARPLRQRGIVTAKTDDRFREQISRIGKLCIRLSRASS